MPHRVAFRKERLRERLIDHRHPGRIGAVLLTEEAALLQRNSHGLEIAGRGVTLLHIGHCRGRRPRTAGNFEIAAMAAPAERQAVHCARGNHAGQRPDTRQHLRIEGGDARRIIGRRLPIDQVVECV